MLKRQPTLKGFLTCWTCNETYADFDLVVSASPCILQCRGCAARVRKVAELRRSWPSTVSQPERSELLEAA